MLFLLCVNCYIVSTSIRHVSQLLFASFIIVALSLSFRCHIVTNKYQMSSFFMLIQQYNNDVLLSLFVLAFAKQFKNIRNVTWLIEFIYFNLTASQPLATAIIIIQWRASQASRGVARHAPPRCEVTFDSHASKPTNSCTIRFYSGNATCSHMHYILYNTSYYSSDIATYPPSQAVRDTHQAHYSIQPVVRYGKRACPKVQGKVQS